jgi:hypothetical protein
MVATCAPGREPSFLVDENSGSQGVNPQRWQPARYRSFNCADATGSFGRLCRPLDYVDLMPCVYPATLAGAGDDKTTVNIIHKSPSIWKCSRGDIRMPIIVALPVFVRLHRKSTTDLASSGSRQTSEIMMTSYNQLLWKIRTVHSFRDNSLWQLYIIRRST